MAGLRIVVGSDDAGFDYKEALKNDLQADDRVAEVTDVGVSAEENTAYPHVAVAAARLIAEGRPTAHCWSAEPGWVWRSARTRCLVSGRSPRTTASRWSVRCCRTMPRCCASGSG